MKCAAFACRVACLVLAGACAAQDAAPASLCGDVPCAPRCEELPSVLCDVLQDYCQARIFEAVQCVRGTPGSLPEVRVLTEDAYRAELEASNEETLDAGLEDDDDGGSPAADGDVEIDHWSRGLQLLGLLAPDADLQGASIENQVRSVIGLYSSSDRRVTLIDRGEPLDTPAATRLIAHELVHALQDQSVGLGRAPGRTTDAALSLRCLVEGEADLYDELTWALLQDLQIDSAFWDLRLEEALKYRRRDVLDAPSPYASVGTLAYAVGTRYLVDAWQRGGSWEVRALFEAPPISSIHWMVGFEENQARREPLLKPLACARAALPSGYEVAFVDTLGPFVLYAFLGTILRDEERLESEAQWRNALHWRQDSFSVLRGPAGETAISLRVRFDGAALAEKLASELRTRAPLPLEIHQHGDEIEVLAADDSAVLEALRTDPASCPEPL
jgi:hypothetical protein